MATKGKTRQALATGANRSPKAQTKGHANVPEHEIARRAYALFLSRDREHGHDLDDWLQAERALRRTTV